MVQVKQSLPLCIILSAIGGILEVFATAVLAYPDAQSKKKDGKKWSSTMKHMCLIINVVLQIGASIVGNLIAPWYGPVSIVGPTFLSAQLVANMVIYGYLLGLESFTKDMKIGTAVIVTAAVLLPVVGPGVQEYSTDVMSLLDTWYSYTWNIILIAGMIISAAILLAYKVSPKVQLVNQMLRFSVLLIARSSAFSLNLTFSKVFALDPDGVLLVVSIILKVLSGAVMTGAIVIQSTAVSQNTFVPLNATCIILVNALSGIIVWEDWNAMASWLGYITVFVQLILGNYLLLGEIDLFGSSNKRYGRAYQLEKATEEIEVVLNRVTGGRVFSNVVTATANGTDTPAHDDSSDGYEDNDMVEVVLSTKKEENSSSNNNSKKKKKDDNNENEEFPITPSTVNSDVCNVFNDDDNTESDEVGPHDEIDEERAEMAMKKNDNEVTTQNDAAVIGQVVGTPVESPPSSVLNTSITSTNTGVNIAELWLAGSGDGKEEKHDGTNQQKQLPPAIVTTQQPYHQEASVDDSGVDEQQNVQTQQKQEQESSLCNDSLMSTSINDDSISRPKRLVRRVLTTGSTITTRVKETSEKVGNKVKTTGGKVIAVTSSKVIAPVIDVAVKRPVAMLNLPNKDDPEIEARKEVWGELFGVDPRWLEHRAANRIQEHVVVLPTREPVPVVEDTSNNNNNNRPSTEVNNKTSRNSEASISSSSVSNHNGDIENQQHIQTVTEETNEGNCLL